MAPLARSLVSIVLALGLGVSAVARAEGPPRLSIAAAGACPSAADVAEELRELMPDATLALSPDVVDSDVIASDRGAGFAVKVRGQRRRFRDAKRDGTERARHVAVFTALKYQKKYPNGALKEEALAIAFESAAARKGASATRLAQGYLAAFPQGRFRAQAEQVLSNR